MATPKPNKKPAVADCTPAHPDTPVVGGIGLFLCSLADKANVPQDKDPTTPIAKNIDKATSLAQLANISPTEWKAIIIIGGIILLMLVLKR